jgi:hypothetical protein
MNAQKRKKRPGMQNARADMAQDDEGEEKATGCCRTCSGRGVYKNGVDVKEEQAGTCLGFLFLCLGVTSQSPPLPLHHHRHS